jgi:PAS domain S-box-containing protein
MSSKLEAPPQLESVVVNAQPLERIDPGLYRDLLESAPDAVVLIESEGRILLVNRQAERLFGYERNELIGQPIEALVPEQFRKVHAVHRDSYFAEPKVREMGAGLELAGRRKDGTEFPIEISLSPIRTQKGMLVTAAIRDATERRRANEMFRALLESAPDAMVIIDDSGVIRLANAQAQTLFGYQREALIGKRVEVLIPERLRAQHAAHRTGYFASPKLRSMGTGLELSGRRKDGSEFPIEISLSPLHTEDGVWATAAVRDISDRKRAEERFRALLETAPDAMVIINAKGRIELVNAQTERIFGYARADLIGQTVEMLVPERLRGQHLAHRGEFFRAPKVREMGAGAELSGRRRDGSEFPIEISLSPLETEQGTWVTAAIRDVTQSKRERDAAVRLAAIVESSNDAIIGKDMQGRITSWNRAATQTFGYTADQAIGQEITMLFPSERLHEEQLILDRVRGGEQIKHFETQRRAADGRLLEMSLTISPILNAAGRVVGASTIGRDISERRQAEARFRSLLETAPDAMVIIDREGRIVLVNAQTERLFGYTRDRMIGQPVEMLIPHRLRARHSEHRGSYFTSPKVREMGAGLELSGVRSNGEEFAIEISLSPMDAGGERLATAAVRDISDRKAVERKLAQYAEDLTRSNRDLEQFAYVASHDLQAPLRSVIGFSQLLRRRYDSKLDQDGREFLEHVESSARHMQALVNGVLAFSRVGSQGADFVEVDAEAVLRDVENNLSGVVHERGARITHDPLPRVRASKIEFNQLLQNLIVNGLKFQPGETPRVHVSATREKRAWHFSVRDWGIGIGTEHQERIFQIFQRLHPPEAYEGTGIGLAVCQKIVQRHGGRIWVESIPGEGATFHFTLQVE